MARNDILARLAVLLTADSAGLKKDTAQAAKAMEGFSKSASGALNVVKGAIATLGLAAIGREIIDVTAQFQKFSAVLSNTLGSNSAAAIAIRDIEKFASQTPFAVDELTSSFVKLANQGFTPTTDELRKLGDLASSTGKGFDQLTEAIIDAQVGEFERLKEFGVRAKKQGDQVTFTFKGVETQTKFTSQAIRDYILSLGDAEGVSGSMAKISETLGGQISNLGDTWTTFLKTIGDGNDGILSGTVTLLSEALKIATDLIKTNKQIQKEAQTEGQSQVLEDLKELEKITGDVEAASVTLIKRLEEQKEAIVDQAAPLFANFDANEKTIESLNNKALVIDAQIQAINEYTAATVKNTQAQLAANAATVASVGLIQGIENQLKILEAAKKSAFNTDAIAQFNVKIQELRDQLDVLNASRPLSKFAQDQLDAATQGLEFKLPKLDAEFDATGGLTNSLPTSIPVPDIAPAMEALKTYTDGIKAAGAGAIEDYDQMRLAQQMMIDKQQLATQSALEFGDAVGQAAGNALSGNQTVLQSILGLVAKLIPKFFAMSIAGVTAGAAGTAAPPPVILALAAAGIAGISAIFAKIGGPRGSGGGGGGSSLGQQAADSVRRAPTIAAGNQITFDAQFEIQGTKLVAVVNNQNQRSTRTG